MEIQTDITKKDVVDFNLYHWSHSPTVKRRRLMLLLPGLIWSGFWLALCWLSDEPLKAVSALLPLIMAGPLYIVTFLVLGRWGLSRQIQRYLAEGENKGVFGPQRVIISADGVTDIGELSQSITQWKAVERVISTDDCLYIYINALAAVIVPKRFFPNDTAFEDFIKTAKEYHAQATH